MTTKTKWLSTTEKIFICFAVLLLGAYCFQEKCLLYDILSNGAFYFSRIQDFFHQISNPNDNLIFWMPTALSIIVPIIGMIFFPKPSRLLRYMIVITMALLHTIYILFRTFYTLRFNNIGSGIATILLWISEVMIYICSLSLYIQLLFSVDRKHMADKYEKDVLAKTYEPLVDIFITTFTEPLEMIRRTVVGCQAVKYNNKKIYILDDGNRENIKALSKELNCEYITREQNTHAKAGNVNNALTKTHGELIAMFDADCIPSKNFLSRTIGFFQEKDVALVSSAQRFYNGDMFNHNIMALMEQSNFFRHTQSGRDQFNALLCFGTCYVLRRRAMKSIGGVPTETLSEDWATSIKLQASGYKTYMLDEFLGAGAVAESMNEFLYQRVRWAQGTLQALFSSTNPFSIKGLSFMQRFIHSYGIMHYLINPFLILIMVLPLLYFFFGFSPFYPSKGGFWMFFVPFFFFNALGISWICKEYTSKLSSMVSETFLSVPISIAIIKTLFKPFGWRFRVTRKGIFRKTHTMNWTIGAPLLIFLIISIIGVAYGYQNRFWSISEELFFFLFIITALRMIFLWIGLYAAFDFPQQRNAVRFNHQLNCSFSGANEIKGKTVDISEQGLLMKPLLPINKIQDNSIGILSINFNTPLNIPVELVRTHKETMAMVFKDLPLATYRQIIEFLYCNPQSAQEESSLDTKVTKAFNESLSWNHILKKT